MLKCSEGDCIKYDSINNKTVKKRGSSGEEKMGSSEKRKSSGERKRGSSSETRRRLGERKRGSSSEKRKSSGERKRGSSDNKATGESTKRGRESSETKTPRSVYAMRYFADNKSRIHLLDKIGKNKSKTIMFQVNYDDVEQFTNYQNLSSNPRVDCVFQSLFSLGLRDVELVKRDSLNVNTHGRKGVNKDEVILFIKTAFALSPEEDVTEEFMVLGNETPKLIREKPKLNDKIVKLFNKNLKNGYATTIAIAMRMSNGVTGGHNIVVYKYDNQIYFFNPQGKSTYNPSRVVNSTNIYDLFNPTTWIMGLSYFEISNLKSPKPLVNTSCPMRYVG